MSNILDKPADEIIKGYVRLQKENRRLRSDLDKAREANGKLAENLGRCLPPNIEMETLEDLVL